jgi:hypothetical protein
MRLENYINESTDEDKLQIFLSEVSDYLKEMNGVRLWRATNKDIKGIQKFSARQNRQPRDTPLEVHKWLDDWFKKNFGWRARSQGVFAASTSGGIQMFGKNVNLIYPCNGYKYIYSNSIHDLTEYLDTQGYINEVEAGGEWEIDPKFNDLRFREQLSKILKQEYTDKKLPDSSYNATEVMLYCPNGYYQLDGDFFRKFADDIYPPK